MSKAPLFRFGDDEVAENDHPLRILELLGINEVGVELGWVFASKIDLHEARVLAHDVVGKRGDSDARFDGPAQAVGAVDPERRGPWLTVLAAGGFEPIHGLEIGRRLTEN